MTYLSQQRRTVCRFEGREKYKQRGTRSGSLALVASRTAVHVGPVVWWSGALLVWWSPGPPGGLGGLRVVSSHGCVVVVVVVAVVLQIGRPDRCRLGCGHLLLSVCMYVCMCIYIYLYIYRFIDL